MITTKEVEEFSSLLRQNMRVPSKPKALYKLDLMIEECYKNLYY